MFNDEDASVITFVLIIIAYLLLIRNLNLPLSHVSKHTSPRMQTLGFSNTYTEFLSYVIQPLKITQFQTIWFKLFRFWGVKSGLWIPCWDQWDQTVWDWLSVEAREPALCIRVPCFSTFSIIFYKRRQQSGATSWRAVCKRSRAPSVTWSCTTGGGDKGSIGGDGACGVGVEHTAPSFQGLWHWSHTKRSSLKSAMSSNNRTKTETCVISSVLVRVCVCLCVLH